MPAHLTRLDVRDPRAAVLVLHGGKPRSERTVDRGSASWQRMAAMQRRLHPDWEDAGVSSWLLRYRARGWNAGHGSVDDARWALSEVRRELGDVPVVLLGHSMGGRVAVHVADDESVVGVVALAPWWEPADPVATLAGRRVVAAHGRRDRITSFRMTEQYLARARASGIDTTMVDMGLLGHYMLSGTQRWNDVALDATLALACEDRDPA
ncbi:lysophospholipase [Nocardioides panacisoli]|uniref:alpha/beta hydrolase n=1 Tax=Nocardioides panacisoli TaxID=627624 RepID=UPI001C6284E3|nr:alpha/beta fold hydrolase [Nocardioides panacisoli]QYJ04446.1 lysophospholipase [Nocardioides panacisoli]